MSSSSAVAPEDDHLLSERETYMLLIYIECVGSLVKWVRFLVMSHPLLEHSLFAAACKASDQLETIHPQGKIVEGPELRVQLAVLAVAARQLYERTCEQLRERGSSLVLREDLESKLSVALANMEMEQRKCTLQTTNEDGRERAYFNVLAPNEQSVRFWMEGVFEDCDFNVTALFSPSTARSSQKVEAILDAVPRLESVAVDDNGNGGGRLTGHRLRLGHRRGGHLAGGDADDRVRGQFRAQRHPRQGAADARPSRPEGSGRCQGGPRETDHTCDQGAGRRFRWLSTKLIAHERIECGISFYWNN